MEVTNSTIYKRKVNQNMRDFILIYETEWPQLQFCTMQLRPCYPERVWFISSDV